MRKVLRIIFNIVLFLVLVLALFVVVLTVVSKKDYDGTVEVFGNQFRIVQTASMEKNDDVDVSAYAIKDIPTGSMVFVETVPENAEDAKSWYASLKLGDVLTFKYYIANTQYTITHRIINIAEGTDGGYLLSLRGDNVQSKDASIGGITVQEIDTSAIDSYNYVVGKVTWQSRFLGFLVGALKQPVVLTLMVILPCIIIIVIEVINVINIFKDKSTKRDEMETEIETLKRQLEELKQSKGNKEGK